MSKDDFYGHAYFHAQYYRTSLHTFCLATEEELKYRDPYEIYECGGRFYVKEVECRVRVISNDEGGVRPNSESRNYDYYACKSCGNYTSKEVKTLLRGWMYHCFFCDYREVDEWSLY